MDSEPLWTRRALLLSAVAGLAACTGSPSSSAGSTSAAPSPPATPVVPTKTGAASPVASASSGAGSPVPDPVRSLVTRWKDDPWALGSYSYIPRGCDPAVREVIATTVVEGRLTFASEAFDPDWPSTVQGALASGRRAAGLLLDEGTPQTVVVIGAGVAGIAAATKLSQAGCAVTLIEARDRLGGRVSTYRGWGGTVELGAAWVHGTTGNPLVGLLSGREGVSLVPTDYDDQVVRTLTGAVIPDRQVSAAEDRLADAIEEARSLSYPRPASLAQGLAAVGWSPTGANNLDGFSLITNIEQEYAASATRLDLQGFDAGAEIQGGDALVAGGYDSLTRSLLDQAESVALQLKTAAVRVRRDGEQILVDTVSSDPQRPADPGAKGVTLKADAVVVAVPVALLAKGMPQLTPSLASLGYQETAEAIASLGTGVLDKVFLEFPRQFWDDAEVLGFVGTPSGAFAEWFDISRLRSGAPTLVGFSAGSAAEGLSRDPAAVVAAAMNVLRGAYR